MTILDAPSASTTSTAHTYCSLCKVGCPTVVTLEGSRVISLEPDRAHPHGGVMCGKGRAAPEIHDHPHRVNYPLRRTRPKTAAEPGWERCSWDEALDLIVAKLSEVRDTSGPQAVIFGKGTGGGTGLKETEAWLLRFANCFGSPNILSTVHLCNWPRDGGSSYTWGVGVLPPPEAAGSNSIFLWGINPNATKLGLARDVLAARARGARLVVVDPRKIGLANKADLVLQVRPGTDGALALAFIHLLIENQWYDEGFVRQWTNAPLLVREDTGRLLTVDDLAPEAVADDGGSGAETRYVAIEAGSGQFVALVPSTGRYGASPRTLALRGAAVAALRDGRRVRCRPVFELLTDEARRCTPDVAAEITGVPEPQIHEAVKLIVENRPVSHFLHNGLVQHTNATQAVRAIEIFYALLGDWDRPGGNVVPMPLQIGDIVARRVLPAEQAARRLGLDEQPLGPPAIPGSVPAYHFYTSVLEGAPYQVRALLSLGGNAIMANGDSLRGRAAFQQLEFFAQAELFHTPTSQYADVLLPAADFLEAEALSVGENGLVQRRPKVVDPLYERRSDLQILVDLADRLGFGEYFGRGSVATAVDDILAPTGMGWDGLLAYPYGVRLAPPLRYQKYAEQDADDRSAGFSTPTRKVELFSDRFAAHGQPPLPTYQEPAESPVSTPELAREFPLVMTNAKRAQYLHSQHRGIAAIRKTAPQPTLEIHPDTASEHGVVHGAWMIVETPRGRVRAVAEVTKSIKPGVVCGNHGWWEACEELGLTALDPFDERGANMNLLVHNDKRDPVSGGIPHRSTLCRVRPEE